MQEPHPVGTKVPGFQETIILQGGLYVSRATKASHSNSLWSCCAVRVPITLLLLPALSMGLAMNGF